MNRKRWLAAVAAATLATATGCVCCNHASYRTAREYGPECDLALAQRQRTYLFMVNGLVPDTASGLGGLRADLARQGFAKVGHGQVFDAPLMFGEIRRIHAADPAARFVLLGYDVGGPAAAWLANDLTAAGVPVEALVLLDPVGSSVARGDVRTVVITSGSKPPSATAAESVSVPECGHFTLPSHPKTVGFVADLLTTVAGKTHVDAPIEPSVEWAYEHATPKAAASAAGPDSPAEWNFLLDLPGNHAEPLLPVTPIVQRR